MALCFSTPTSTIVAVIGSLGHLVTTAPTLRTVPQPLPQIYKNVATLETFQTNIF